MSCTGIKLLSTQNNVFWGRTQEYDVEYDYVGMTIPKDYEISLSFSKIKSNHKIAGIGIRNEGIVIPGVVDGVNDSGLNGGSFYFSNYNKYIDKDEITGMGKVPLSGVEFVTWALATCGSVDELKEKALKEVAIASNVGLTGPSLPQHYVFQDTTGRSIVIEPSIEGSFKIFDNLIGVFTNNPPFDWHLINLENYVGMQREIHPNSKFEDLDVSSSGKGNGIFGVPGDFTPQSRFVRASILKSFVNKVDNSHTPNLLFHLLDTSDIPKGVIDRKGKFQYTQYISVYDLSAEAVYISTYDNRQVQTFSMTDGSDVDLSSFEISQVQNIQKMKKL